jgi:hypothetical protein
MDAGSGARDRWRFVFDTVVDRGASTRNGGLPSAKDSRRRSRCRRPICFRLSAKIWTHVSDMISFPKLTPKTCALPGPIALLKAPRGSNPGLEEHCPLRGRSLALSGIQMLFEMQRSKAARLHIKEASENLAKIIRVLIAAGDCNFIDVHRRQK